MFMKIKTKEKQDWSFLQVYATFFGHFEPVD